VQLSMSGGNKSLAHSLSSGAIVRTRKLIVEADAIPAVLANAYSLKFESTRQRRIW